MDLAHESVILEMLKLYEKEPVLWDPRHPLHKSRNAVNEGWKRIQAGMSIKCTVEELKKKKESLMATYRPLARRVKQSKKSGVGANRVHKPTWFAYETMANFLTPVYNARLTLNNEEMREDTTEKRPRRQEEVEDESTDSVIAPCDTAPDVSNVGKKLKFLEPKERRKRKLLQTDTIEARMTEAYEVMKNVSKKQASKDKDICDLYTELLSAKLRDFDELTRTVVMNEIDNLVFRAKMQQQDSCPAGPSTSNGHHFLPSRCVDNTYRSPSPRSENSGSQSAMSPRTVTLSPSATPPAAFHSPQKSDAD